MLETLPVEHSTQSDKIERQPADLERDSNNIESKHPEPIVVNYDQMVSEQMSSLARMNPAELFKQNQTDLEQLRQQNNEKLNDVPPTFFDLTWDDVPSTTDPETGEKVYEVKSGKYDENGNQNLEHNLLNQVPLPAESTIIVHNPNGTVVIYKTDKLGRVISMETTNVTVVDGARKQNPGEVGNETSKTKTLKDGKENDQGGHLFGDQFGGCSEQINLVPMSVEVNLSAFKKVENAIKKAILEGKKVTDLKVEVVYDGNSSRPIGFKVSYKIDGKPVSTIIPKN